jgi:hypothetical protein
MSALLLAVGAMRMAPVPRVSRANQTNLIGAAGESYVAAELSRAGWLATVTLKNAPGIDVLAFQPPPGRRSVAIQTKTTVGGSWVLRTPRSDFEHRDDTYFVLVRLRAAKDRPSFYVVPAVVMDRIVSWHRNDFVARNDRAPSMNTINASWITHFEEAWHLLEGPSPAGDLLDERYRHSSNAGPNT